tara:strand:- start:992 stop:1819 length:828 start_codon:yes stop_codon:yes gene_type:complete
MEDKINDLPEKYWHCFIEKQGKSALMSGMTREELLSRVLRPLYAKRTFSVASMIVRDVDELDKIMITHNPNPSTHYEAPAGRVGTNRYRPKPANHRRIAFQKGVDHTQALVWDVIATPEDREELAMPTNKVFVVHGHDEAAREKVARFLEKAGLDPIILHEQANGGRTVIEKVERFGDVSFAVVLLTPDDIGSVKHGSVQELRARQNVLLELGYFMGRLGRDRVCMLRKGDVSIPTDFAGSVWVNLDDGDGWRGKLVKELQEAGHQVDLTALARY